MVIRGFHPLSATLTGGPTMFRGRSAGHRIKVSGTASGLMNTGSAVAAALSPTAFGYIVDWTGNWQRLSSIAGLPAARLAAGVQDASGEGVRG